MTRIKARNDKDNRIEQEADRSVFYFWERKVDGGVLNGEAELRKPAEGAAATKG